MPKVIGWQQIKVSSAIIPWEWSNLYPLYFDIRWILLVMLLMVRFHSSSITDSWTFQLTLEKKKPNLTDICNNNSNKWYKRGNWTLLCCRNLCDQMVKAHLVKKWPPRRKGIPVWFQPRDTISLIGGYSFFCLRNRECPHKHVCPVKNEHLHWCVCVCIVIKWLSLHIYIRNFEKARVRKWKSLNEERQYRGRRKRKQVKRKKRTEF